MAFSFCLEYGKIKQEFEGEIMSEIKTLTKKTWDVLKKEGIKGVQKRTQHFIAQKKEASIKGEIFKDVLFINGCSRDLLGQSVRYRVDHQKEQLECFGMTCDEVYYKNIQMDQVRLYRNFILFRCIHTKELEEFVRKAKACNKRVYYDVDDLVIDTCYTDQIPSLSTLTQQERLRYDQDVLSRKKMLMLCDGAITTTTRLQKELKKYVPLVFINRNCASLEICSISQKTKKTEHQKIKIGYFSGSMTHNDDLKMILPVLKTILNQYDSVELHLVGELTYPEELQPFSSQIKVHPLMDHKELPAKIADTDINLAPLCDTIFNEAKSEIKWMESALVKTCTIASRIGAFKEVVQDEKTGLLCSNLKEWETALIRLIENKEERERIANQAYAYCMENYISIYNGDGFMRWLEKHQSRSIMFAMTKIEISGGIMVAFRHMMALRKAGVDVSVLSLYDSIHWTTFLTDEFPVLELNSAKLQGHIDQGVATMWPTVQLLQMVPVIQQRLYLVQNFETDFYDFSDPLKKQANQSYRPQVDFKFITISKWCQSWLKKQYDQDALWAYNGVDTKQFYPKKREMKNKIRILIEGDCQAAHKNVDESFEIVKRLDPERFEIWYMSYNATPKSWYRIDRFFHRIPYEEVADVYRQCDILLKTSLLESFSYPPLEMMATGGFVVALYNDGNREYLKDGQNVLVYEQGHIDQAVDCIERIVHDEKLREHLYQNGILCAQNRDWSCINQQILSLYGL